MSLFDKSLVQRSFEPGGDGRFSMLETIRQFALERLRESGDESSLRDRHLEYFLALAERADRACRGPLQAGWIEQVTREQDNMRAALEWGLATRQTELALRLLGALGWPWEVRGYYSEALQWFEKIRAMPGLTDHPVVLARLLNHLGRYCWTQENWREGRAFLEESCALTEHLTDPAAELCLAETFNWLGLGILLTERDASAARSTFKRALELSRKQENAWCVALSTFHLGILELELNESDQALSLLDQGLAMFQELGDVFFIARVSLFLGYLYLKHKKDFDRALVFFKQHLALDSQIQFQDGIAEGWRDLGNLYFDMESYEQARECYEQCVAVCLTHGLAKYEVFYSSGRLALRFNEPALAQTRLIQALVRAHKVKDNAGIALVLLGLAAVAGGAGQPEQAARLSGASRAMIESLEGHYPPHEQEVLEPYIQSARRQMGETAFESHARAGSVMTVDQAVACALGVAL